MKKHLSPILLLAALLGVAASLSIFPGCQATPARLAYNTVSVPTVSLDRAMIAWGDYVHQFHPGTNEEAKVAAAYDKAKAADLLAIDAAHTAALLLSSTNSAAVAAAQSEAAMDASTASLSLGDLVGLLKTLGVKLP